MRGEIMQFAARHQCIPADGAWRKPLDLNASTFQEHDHLLDEHMDDHANVKHDHVLDEQTSNLIDDHAFQSRSGSMIMY
jgi:hypothetical protein